LGVYNKFFIGFSVITRTFVGKEAFKHISLNASFLVLTFESIETCEQTSMFFSKTIELINCLIVNNYKFVMTFLESNKLCTIVDKITEVVIKIISGGANIFE